MKCYYTKEWGNNMNEKDLYQDVARALNKKFASLGKCYFEVTATGNFPPKLERKLDDYSLFIFKEEKYSPDITGFVTKNETYGTEQKLIVAEVKKRIRLTNIYQTKRYAEILNAEYALLISPEPISERKRRFIIQRKPALTTYYPNRQIIIVQLVLESATRGGPVEYLLKVDKDMYLSLPEPFKKESK